jgi:hypothetical protein
MPPPPFSRQICIVTYLPISDFSYSFFANFTGLLKVHCFCKVPSKKTVCKNSNVSDPDRHASAFNLALMDPDSVALSLTKKNLPINVCPQGLIHAFFYLTEYSTSVRTYHILGSNFYHFKAKRHDFEKKEQCKNQLLVRRNSDPESQIRKKTHCMRIRHTVKTIKKHKDGL